MRWSVSLQRELPGQWVAEGAYVASRSYDLTTDFNANPVPRQYLSTSPVRDTAVINFLTANVAYALARNDIAPEFRAELKRLLKDL